MQTAKGTLIALIVATLILGLAPFVVSHAEETLSSVTPAAAPRLVKSTNSPDVYELRDDGTKWLFANEDIFRNYYLTKPATDPNSGAIYQDRDYYSFDQVETIPFAELNGYRWAGYIPTPDAGTDINVGDDLTCPGDRQIYRIDEGLTRWAYPDARIWNSWLGVPGRNEGEGLGFHGTLKSVSCSALDVYKIVGSVTPLPGTLLLKHPASSDVFAVEPGGVVRKINSPSQARAIYGDDWASRIDEIREPHWSHFYFKEPLKDGEIPSGTIWKVPDSVFVNDLYQHKINAYFIFDNGVWRPTWAPDSDAYARVVSIDAVTPFSPDYHTFGDFYLRYPPAMVHPVTDGDLVRCPADPTVYYFGSMNWYNWAGVKPDKVTYTTWFSDYTRTDYPTSSVIWPYPDEFTFKSRHSNFSTVRTISCGELGRAFKMPNMMTILPGTYLVKKAGASDVYAIEPGGVLRAIINEEQARAIYGDNWETRVRTLSDERFADYEVGAPLGSDEVPTGTLMRTADGSGYFTIMDESRGEPVTWPKRDDPYKILLSFAVPYNPLAAQMSVSLEPYPYYEDPGAIENTRFDPLDVCEPYYESPSFVRQNFDGIDELTAYYGTMWALPTVDSDYDRAAGDAPPIVAGVGRDGTSALQLTNPTPANDAAARLYNEDVYFWPNNFYLQFGEKYKFGAWVRYDGPRPLTLSIGKHTDDNRGLFMREEHYTVGNDWQCVTLEFYGNTSTEPPLLYFGDATDGSLYVDDVQIVQETRTPR